MSCEAFVVVKMWIVVFWHHVVLQMVINFQRNILPPSSAQKMDIISSSKTLLTTYKTTHNPNHFWNKFHPLAANTTSICILYFGISVVCIMSKLHTRTIESAQYILYYSLPFWLCVSVNVHHQVNLYTLHDTLVTSINAFYHYLYHALYIYYYCGFSHIYKASDKTAVKHCSDS
jgi:hypothetical protein